MMSSKLLVANIIQYVFKPLILTLPTQLGSIIRYDVPSKP